jgi:hypothetical protein
MGLFSDMRKAQEMSADEVVPVPAGRIDTVVGDPVSGEQRRRTDYAGTVWFGGRPQIVGGQPLPGRNAEIQTPFWLPDSHRYEPGAGGDVQLQASAAVQGGMATSAGGNFQILEVAAALGEDPQSGGALRVFVAVTAVTTLPLGVAYHVTVVCPAEALQRVAPG